MPAAENRKRSLKLATWNVNSLTVRLPQVLAWLAAQQPDVLCLQETKLEDDKFPVDAIRDAGYVAHFTGQRAYNGVALLSRLDATERVAALPNFADEQKRLIAGSFDGVRVVCVYVPNGQSIESEKYQYKLQWLEAFTQWLQQQLQSYPKLAVLGDFNIAPEDRDVYNPESWQGQVLVSDKERAALRQLLHLGLQDSFRLFEQGEGHYTWWDYRAGAFRRNMGLRIDHILVSSALAAQCKTCSIDKTPRKHERPSDHAPVMIELESGV